MKKNKTLSIPMFVTIYLCLIGICVLLDQLTKFWIYEELLSDRREVEVLGSFMVFTPVLNEGAAFGFGKRDWANILFFVITVVGTPLFAYLLWRARKRSVTGQVGFAFIVGGTIGNAIDRAYFHATDKFFSGQVRDFIHFSFFDPVFNVADSFLTIGVILAIVAIVFVDPDSLLATAKKERQAKSAASNDATAPSGQPLAEEKQGEPLTKSNNGQAANDNSVSTEKTDENH